MMRSFVSIYEINARVVYFILYIDNLCILYLLFYSVSRYVQRYQNTRSVCGLFTKSYIQHNVAKLPTGSSYGKSESTYLPYKLTSTQ